MAGQVPISGKHAAEVHNQALEKAATFLEKTAQDLEQSANQFADVGSKVHAEAMSKGRLLRGQASHIREMKLTTQ